MLLLLYSFVFYSIYAVTIYLCIHYDIKLLLIDLGISVEKAGFSFVISLKKNYMKVQFYVGEKR